MAFRFKKGAISSACLLMFAVDASSGETVLALNGGNGSQYVATGVQCPAQTFTFETWLFMTNYHSSGQTLLATQFKGNSTAGDMQIYIRNGKPSFFLRSPGITYIDGSATVPVGQWHHLAVVRQGAEVKLYLNGQLDSTLTFSTVDITQDVPFELGRNPSYSFPGYLAEARLWKTARTHAQILSNMNKRWTGVTADLCGVWPLNDGTGVSAANLAGTAATLTGGAGWYSDGTLSLDSGDTAYMPCYSFDGRPDGSHIATGVAFPPELHEFTVEAWVYPSSTNLESNFLASYQGGLQGDLMCAVRNGTFGFFLRGTRASGAGVSWYASPTVLETNTWYHVAMVRKGAEVATYINGVFNDRTLDWATNAVLSDTQIRIGSQGNVVPFHGALTEVRVWTNALGQADIYERHDRRLTGGEEGLYAYWPLESPDVKQDIVSGSNMVFNGGGWLAGSEYQTPNASSNYEYCLSLDGRNGANYVQTGVQCPAQTFTFETWFFMTNYHSSGQNLLAAQFKGNATAGDMQIYIRNEKPSFFLRSPGITYIDGSATVPVGQWHHLAVVRQGAEVKLYLNGQLDSTLTFSTADITQDVPFELGRNPSYSFPGYLAEARLWSTARDAGQISRFYRRRASGAEQGLLAYWPLNEGKGEVIANIAVGAPCDGVLMPGRASDWRVDRELYFLPPPPLGLMIEIK